MDSRVSKALVRALAGAATLAAAMVGCSGEGILSGPRPSSPPSATSPDPTGAPALPPGTKPIPTVEVPAGLQAAGLTAPVPGTTQEAMPPEVVDLLKARCASCHTYGQADPAGWGSVLDLSRMVDGDIVVPGDPTASRLFDRVAVAGNMPPSGPRLTGEEVGLLKEWITNLRRPAEQPLSDLDVLDLIAVDQLKLRDRSSDFRYVSFANFAGEGRSAGEMDALRQVFTFVMNSVSRRGALVDMPTVDEGRSVFRIRLSEMGWDEKVWDTLTSFYPFCLSSNTTAHQALYTQLHTEAPVVRGDWFLATATRSPLYDKLVDLPASLDQLASRLGIDINKDINHPGLATPDNLVRIGFRRSSVAQHNRMVERHLGAAGQYLWITYDFLSNDGPSDVLANPLGPKARDQQMFQHVFENNGGEVIFSMPNGLQGYMVVDGAGKKLAAAPLAVVRDLHRRDGVVQNGLSCFGCHGATGLLKPRQTDEVFNFSDTHISQFLGRELDEISGTYPKVLRNDVFATDATRYRAIAQSAPGGAPPFSDGADYAAYLTAIGQYESSLGFHGAASEFGEEFESFRERVLANDFANIDLPRTPTAPLVLRDDFVCLFRELVVKVRANARFCANTFSANEVKNLCSGGGSSSSPPVKTAPPPSAPSPDAGAPADPSSATRDAGAAPDAAGTTCRRIDGRRVCS
jgi:mono/diheme cytochrome c family protein